MYQWRPYVSVARRRRQAESELSRLKKNGHRPSPVIISGREIASTFWGQAWCDNLETYSDLENRLPRGRTYARNGSVVDLQITACNIDALVSGSELYRVQVQVAALAGARWRSICKDCAGEIDSLVELLQGRFSQGVMERICDVRRGLFPAAGEIQFSCSCPDWAYMCKHVAAVLYGVGARLDDQPDLLFKLRQVDEKDLITHVGQSVSLAIPAPATDKVLASDDLGAMFGLDLASEATVPAVSVVPAAPAKRTSKKKPTSSRSVRSAKTKKLPASPASPTSPKKKSLSQVAPPRRAAAKRKARRPTKARPRKTTGQRSRKSFEEFLLMLLGAKEKR